MISHLLIPPCRPGVSIPGPDRLVRRAPAHRRYGCGYEYCRKKDIGMKLEKVYAIRFGSLYPLYIKKVESKGRSQEELDEVLRWLTGYSQKQLEAIIAKETNLETFFAEAPELNPARSQITGLICGVRIEDIEEPTMKLIRYMDKLVDELAKGRKMEKILRQ
jgi:hypothetical protein